MLHATLIETQVHLSSNAKKINRNNKRRIGKTVFGFCLLLFLAGAYDSFGQLYLNTFTGASTCPTPGNTPSIAINATGTPVSRTTVTCNATANVFNSTTLNNTASISNTSYIEFSVTANSGFQLNATSLSFFRQGSGTAPNQMEVRYSTDAFGSSTSWGAAPLTPTTGSVTTWDFADFSTLNGGTITIRIYPYGTQRADLAAGAASASGTFRVDDVTLNGTVSSAASSPSITLTAAHPSLANITQGSLNNIIGGISVGVTSANANLTGVTVTTAGTYSAGDLMTTGLRVWLSSSASSITGATQLGTDQVSVGNGGTVAVSGLNQSITAGSTKFILVTANISASGTIGATLRLGSTAFANIAFTSATYVGTSPVAGGATPANDQTIVAGCSAAITPPGPVTICAPNSQTFTASAGSTYAWSTGATTQSISPNTTGTYTVSVTDANGCTATASASLTVNTFGFTGTVFSENFGSSPSTTLVSAYTGWQNTAPITFTSTSTTQADLRNTSGSPTGSGFSGGANVFFGANGDRNIIISGINTSGLTGIVLSFGMRIEAAGTLTVEVADGAGSYSPLTFTPPGGTGTWGLVTASGTIPQSTDLHIRFSKTGTVASFRIDDVKLTASSTSLSVTASGPTTVCNGGTVTLTSSVSSGNVWSPFGQTSSSIVVNQTGTYYTTVTGANGCTASSTPINVTVYDAASVFVSNTDVTCFGGNDGSASVLFYDGPGTPAYSWNTVPPQTTDVITNLVAGTYVVTVTDGTTGCTSTSSVTVSQPTQIIPAFSNLDSSTCHLGTDGGFTVSASGGTPSYEYSLNGTTYFTSGVFTGVSGGAHTVYVRDAASCVVTAIVTVPQPDSLIASAVVTTPITCFGGTAQVTVTASGGVPGYTGTGVFSSSGGPQTYTVTDSYGCAASVTINVINPAPITISISGGPSICGSGTITANPSGGTAPYIYSWSTTATTQGITVSANGDYTVNVTDAHGCTASTTISITILTPPTVSITGNISICSGATGVLDAGSGYASYAWSTGATTQTITWTTPGPFSVTVTGANGCTASTSVTTSYYSNPSPSISGLTTICTGSTGTLDAGPGYSSYLWSTGATTQTINWTTADTYTVTVTNSNGCTGSASVTTHLNAFLTPTITGSLEICAGQSSILDAGSGYDSYSWSTGATTQTISWSTSDTYTVTVSNLSGCTGSASVSTTVHSLPSVDITGNLSFCPGGNTILDAGAGFNSYLWSTTATTQTIAVSTAGTFSVIVTNTFGCSASDAVTTSIYTSPTVSISGPTSFCTGSSIVLDAGVFASYSWSTAATTQTISVSTAGPYSVTVTDNHGCTASASTSITQNPLPTVHITGALQFCNGSSTLLDAGAGFSSYLWSNGPTSQTNSISVAGTYSVTVTDANGCTNSASATVTALATAQATLTPTNISCFGGNGGSVTLTPTNNVTCAPIGPGLLISKVFADPASTDSPFEFVELLATRSIDFSITPYTVIFNNNGNALAKGWVGGLAITYAFSITSGTVTAGNVYYVGGSSMVPSAALQLRAINTGTTGGDGGIGQSNVNGVLGNGGTSADGIAVFDRGIATLDSTTVPVDALFYGSAIGGAFFAASPAGGYQLPVNDHYSGGKVPSTGLFLIAGPASAQLIIANGSFNPDNNTYPTPRTYTTANISTYTASSSISLTNSGYTYSWSNSATTQNITNLTAGNYTVTITACNGCTSSFSATVSQPASALTATLAADSIVCFNGQSTVTISATGGTPPYIGTGLFAESAGPHSYTVTDANGCSSTVSITLGQPAQIVVGGFTPSSGCPGNGVVITGSHLSVATGVLFNGTPSVFSVVNDNTINATVPVGATTGLITVIDANGCTGTSVDPFTVTTCGGGLTLQMKMFIEGFYIGGGQMNACLFNNQITHANASQADTIRVSLMDASTHALVETQVGILGTDGNITITFTSPAGNYFLKVNHRSALETWSASAIPMSSSTTYDFTTSASQAYGDNMILVDANTWAFYSGDISDAVLGLGTQDGVMEAQDYTDMSNAVFFTYVAYTPEDVTGDGVVESADYIIEANNVFFTRVLATP